MPAREKPIEPTWPDEWNEAGTLFADVAEHGRPFYEKPVPPPAPVDASAKTLWESGTPNDHAYQVEQAYSARVALELNAVAEKTKRDDLEYDFITAFPRLPDVPPNRTQVRFRSIRNGFTDFPVGHLDQGRRAGKSDARQLHAYRGGVDTFVLVTWWRDELRWYIIPARKLIGAKTLRVTPGRPRRCRGLDPESYREQWHHLTANANPVGSAVLVNTSPAGLVIPTSLT